MQSENIFISQSPRKMCGIRLDENERQLVENVRKVFGCASFSDAVRFSIILADAIAREKETSHGK